MTGLQDLRFLFQCRSNLLHPGVCGGHGGGNTGYGTAGDEDDDGYWCDHGWWEFDLDRYSASLTADMRITTDEKSPTATGRTMKSGYGFQEKVTTHVSTNQSSAVTSAQNAVTYFPEFQYERFWRLLERMNGGYDMTHEFKKKWLQYL